MPAVRHLRIDSIEVVPDRLDTGYYSYDYFSAKNRLQDSGIPFVEIGAVCEPWCFGAYALCNEIEWCAKEEGIPYVKAEALGAPLLNDSGLSYITPATNTLLAKSQLTAGDIIVSTSGTVGMCAVIPEYIQEINSNQDTIKFRPPKERFDPYFVVAWISTPTAQAILDRESGGAVQKHIYLHNFQQIPLLEPRLVVQQYIGEKVRQAERLQRVAIQLSLRLTNLASMPLIRDALEIQRVRTNRVRADRFTGYRLDSKYYSARALGRLKTPF